MEGGSNKTKMEVGTRQMVTSALETRNTSSKIYVLLQKCVDHYLNIVSSRTVSTVIEFTYWTALLDISQTGIIHIPRMTD